MNGAPNETRTHLCRFVSQACKPLHHQRSPGGERNRLSEISSGESWIFLIKLKCTCRNIFWRNYFVLVKKPASSRIGFLYVLKALAWRWMQYLNSTCHVHYRYVCVCLKYIYIYIYRERVCVWKIFRERVRERERVCVCVWKIFRESERERERERERECVCVCVCVSEKYLERERECVCVCVRESER